MSCGAQLDRSGLSASEHEMLLKLVESMIVTVEQQCLDRHLLPVFKRFLSGNKFGAVVDGMNVALWGHQHKYSFDHKVVC